MDLEPNDGKIKTFLFLNKITFVNALNSVVIMYIEHFSVKVPNYNSAHKYTPGIYGFTFVDKCIRKTNRCACCSELASKL